jgi:hypothetical protein
VAKKAIDVVMIRLRQLPDGIGLRAESGVTLYATTWLRRLRGIPGLENPDPVMPHHRVGRRSIRLHHSCELARFPALQILRDRALLVVQALRHLFRRAVLAGSGGAGCGAFVLLDVLRVGRSRRMRRTSRQGERQCDAKCNERFFLAALLSVGLRDVFPA